MLRKLALRRLAAIRAPDLADDCAVEGEHPDLGGDDEDVASEDKRTDAVDDVSSEVEDKGVGCKVARVAIAVIQHDLWQPRSKTEDHPCENLYATISLSGVTQRI